MSEPTTRFQPSTRTKSRILKGAEIITGGNCIMPTEPVTEATMLGLWELCQRCGASPTAKAVATMKPKNKRELAS